MFFSSDKRKKKQLHDALTSGLEALAERRAGEARRHAETACTLAKPFARFEPDLVEQAASLGHRAAAALDDWAGVQAILEWRVNTLEEALGTHTMRAQLARLDLMDLHCVREAYDKAIHVLDRCKELKPPEMPSQDLQSAFINVWVFQGRYDAAISEAKKQFDEHGRSPNRFVACQLAWVLAKAGQDLERALFLARFAMPPELPGRNVERHPAFRLAARTLALVYSKRGNFNELSAHCDMVRLATRFVPDCVITDEIAVLYSEALLELGMKPRALDLAKTTVRLVELRLGQRHPSLVAPLEGLGWIARRCGEARESDNAERRALAIRRLVVGKTPAPRPPRHPRALMVWPRRTLAGIYAVKGVTPEMVHALLNNVHQTSQSQSFGGLHVQLTPQSQEAVVVLGDYGDPWRAEFAIESRLFLIHLNRAVLVMNAGRPAGSAVQVEPWWAVADTLDVTWGEWPDGVKARLERDDFPQLPGWLGDVTEPRWFGGGVRIEAGQLGPVLPCVQWGYLYHQGIAINAVGPAGTLDGWFTTLARVTGLFHIEAYDPLEPRAELPLAAMAQ